MGSSTFSFSRWPQKLCMKKGMCFHPWFINCCEQLRVLPLPQIDWLNDRGNAPLEFDLGSLSILLVCLFNFRLATSFKCVFLAFLNSVRFKQTKLFIFIFRRLCSTFYRLSLIRELLPAVDVPTAASLDTGWHCRRFAKVQGGCHPLGACLKGRLSWTSGHSQKRVFQQMSVVANTSSLVRCG